MDPFDKSRCSFPVPHFQSEREENDWARTLTPQQRLEILMNLYRYGEEAMNAPMDKTQIAAIGSFDEFNAMKSKLHEEQNAWRRAHGLPTQPEPYRKPS